MHKSSKTLLGAALLMAASSMVACSDSSGGKVQIGAAPRSATAEKLFQCATNQAPKAVKTIVGKDAITVCRAGDDGKIIDSKLTPRFYLGSQKGVMRVAQLLGTDLQYEGKTPDAQVKLEIENEVNHFLKATCGPQIERIFKRSSLDLRLAFRSYRDTDRLSSGAASTVAGAVETSSDDLMGMGVSKLEAEKEASKDDYDE